MIAYHITRKDYEEGEIYKVDNYDGFSDYHSALNEEKKRINDVIDSCRPQNEPSRKKCFYAFEEACQCLGFVKNLEGYKLYKIDINASTPHPMCLIDFLNRHKCLLDSMAHIYWSQTLVEKFQVKELLGTEIRIIERIVLPRNNTPQRMIMNTKYNDDKDYCCSLCRRMKLEL